MDSEQRRLREGIEIVRGIAEGKCSACYGPKAIGGCDHAYAKVALERLESLRAHGEAVAWRVVCASGRPHRYFPTKPQQWEVTACDGEHKHEAPHRLEPLYAAPPPETPGVREALEELLHELDERQGCHDSRCHPEDDYCEDAVEAAIESARAALAQRGGEGE